METQILQEKIYYRVLHRGVYMYMISSVTSLKMSATRLGIAAIILLTQKRRVSSNTLHIVILGPKPALSATTRALFKLHQQHHSRIMYVAKTIDSRDSKNASRPAVCRNLRMLFRTHA